MKKYIVSDSEVMGGVFFTVYITAHGLTMTKYAV
jgi:hypothetical protein